MCGILHGSIGTSLLGWKFNCLRI